MPSSSFGITKDLAKCNAAWMLFAAENKITSFDELIPEEYQPALSYHHKTVASIPLMAYTVPISEIKQAADDGYFFMKIKIAISPYQYF